MFCRGPRPSPNPTSLSSPNVFVFDLSLCSNMDRSQGRFSEKPLTPVQVRSTLGPLKISFCLLLAPYKDCTHIVTEKVVRHAQCFICTCSRFVDGWKVLFFRFRLTKGSGGICVQTVPVSEGVWTSCEKGIWNFFTTFVVDFGARSPGASIYTCLSPGPLWTRTVLKKASCWLTNSIFGLLTVKCFLCWHYDVFCVYYTRA
jgi:hypothetical protein